MIMLGIVLGCGSTSTIRNSSQSSPDNSGESALTKDTSWNIYDGEYEYRDLMEDITLTLKQLGDTLIHFDIHISCHAANLERNIHGIASCDYCGQDPESDVDVDGYLYFVREFFFRQDSCWLSIRIDTDEYKRVRLLADRCLVGDERLCDEFNDVVLRRKLTR
jgi:hypothetical protein